MWLSDPADLQDRLLQTIYYFHAFPPGMDLFTGILLKLAGTHAALLAQITFWLLGLVLVNSLFYLARASGLSARASFIVAVAFSLLPQSIYFEHLYLYEEPIAALLCLSVALFHAALSRQSFRLWLAFFAVCAVIGVTRSTFHLLWFAVMLGLGLWFNTPRDRRRILAAASCAGGAGVALYVKNLIVFGTFSAFTYGPSSYAHVTVSHLTPETKAQWVRERRLSPFAALSPYAGPREYLRVFSGTPPTNWPSQLTDLDRPTVHAPNFNHWVILEANRGRNADALVLPAHAATRVRDHGAARVARISSRRQPSGIPTQGRSGRRTTSIGRCSVATSRSSIASCTASPSRPSASMRSCRW